MCLGNFCIFPVPVSLSVTGGWTGSQAFSEVKDVQPDLVGAGSLMTNRAGLQYPSLPIGAAIWFWNFKLLFSSSVKWFISSSVNGNGFRRIR